MRVLVTDGENRASLAITRSLGRAGHDVFVGEKATPSLAQASRYCVERVLYEDPVSSPERFVDSLADAVRRRHIDVLLPVTDITTFLVTRNRARFACAVPFAVADTVERAADKIGLMEMAARLGVPAPRSVVVAGPGNVPQTDFSYPVVVKPRQSRVRTANGWVSTSVSYARDRDALLRDLAARSPHEFPVMLQERIIGPGVGVFACYHEGRPVALFSHRRLRERPPWGGVSVLAESVPMCPVARASALRLLDGLGWHGVAMVEFKRDVRDDVPKLMEINGRFWGSLQLAIDSGVDFPRLLLQGVETGRFEPQSPYRLGVRTRWFWGDLDSLLVSLFASAGAPEPPRPLHAAVQFMKCFGAGLHYDNPKWFDPVPFVFESFAWLRRTSRDAMRVPVRPVDQGVDGLEAPPVVDSGRNRRMQVAVVSSFDHVGIDPDGWNALAARSDTNSLFQTHEWMRSWWTTYHRQYESLFVTVSDRSGVAGIAPLTMHQRGSRERVVQFLGVGRADYCDFLTCGDKTAVLTAIFDALCEHGHWDVIELCNVPSHSRTLDIVRDVCGKMGLWILAEDQYICPTLLIRGNHSSALEILRKPSMRRRQNYFVRSGRLSCRNLTTAEEIEPWLDAFFAQHVLRWRGLSTPSLFADLPNRAFYRELTKRVSARGWLLFSIVEFNDRPIAFHYGFDYDDTVMWYKPSFDIEYASHSPGIVMVGHLIQYALRLNRRELDFTIGDEAFKRRFTNTARKTVRIRIFRDRLRFVTQRSLRRIASAFKELAG